MTDTVNKPDPEYRVGDRIVCTGDDVDGSWEGSEGVIKRVHWQGGGTLAGSRWIYYFEWDDEEGMRDEDDLDSSDTYQIEPA